MLVLGRTTKSFDRIYGVCPGDSLHSPRLAPRQDRHQAGASVMAIAPPALGVPDDLASLAG
jgi:hypothetical protein